MADIKTTPAPVKSDAEWRAVLTPEQYRVLRQKGTEPAFSGNLWDEHRSGSYRCAGCGTKLFRSDAKFESGTGWPSFFVPADPAAVATETDRSFFTSATSSSAARSPSSSPTCPGRASTAPRVATSSASYASPPSSSAAELMQ